MICRRATYFTDLEMIKYYQKMCGWNDMFLKTKTYAANYARYTMLKKSFLTVYIGMFDCYKNIKIKLSSTASIFKPWCQKLLTTKRKWLQSLTKFCKFCKLTLYQQRNAKQYITILGWTD